MAALLLGAAMVAGGVPTPAVAEAIGQAAAREEGVAAEPEGVRAEGAGAVGVAPEAEAGPDPSGPEAAAAAAPSLPDALPELLPEAPSGDPATEALGAVGYVDEYGNARICNDYTDVSDVRGNALEGGWYVVRESRSFGESVEIHGDVNLILCDGATLRCERGVRNSRECGSRSLTIWGQQKGTGMLVADAREADRAAGIGGHYGEDGGTVVVNGVVVKAYGGKCAAGIGGADGSNAADGSGGTVTVNGGHVEAYGGEFAAGIGGGGSSTATFGNDSRDHGDGGMLTVNGGHVEAHGGERGAGIGGGRGRYGGTVVVNGGYVEAHGGERGAGIGGGDGDAGDLSDGCFGGTVTITGGTVRANVAPGDDPGADVGVFGPAAGIGGGEGGAGGTITITGGDVLAKGSNGAAGIGGGENRDGGNVTISGGKVVAYGSVEDDAGAGIGGGDGGDGGHVTIRGGDVRAYGGHDEEFFDSDAAAGIGGGDGADSGVVEIHGGTVHAEAGYADGTTVEHARGAGIGGGDDANVDSIAVDGGHVIAHGYQAIGHGALAKSYEDGDVSVDYSKVRVLSGKVTGERVELIDRIDEGTCGGCSWRLADGALTVEPADGASGALADADRSADFTFPWLAHAGEIRSAAFAQGVSLPADAHGMFGGCAQLESVALPEGGLSGVTDARYMFLRCSSLASLDVSAWDVSSVEDMSYLFYGCSSLASLDVSGWDVSSVGSMRDMFFGCSSLASLDLSGWDVEEAWNFTDMFKICTSLASLDLSGWRVRPTAVAPGMFDGCSLSRITVGEGFDASKAFPEATSDTKRWWSVADGAWYAVDEIASSRAHVADTYLADPQTCGGCTWSLSGDGALTLAPAEGADGALADADRSGDLAFPWLARKGEVRSVAFREGVSLPADSSRMFDGCSSLESVDLSGCDASGATDMSAMFRGCASLASLDLSGWDVSGAKDVSSMFEGCASLASLGLSRWDLSGARSASAMFRGCSSLASLDLSGWELPGPMVPVSMGHMFDGCSSLGEISVGEGFDASRAFPEPADGSGEWLSLADGAWHSVDEIASSRRGVADTYLACLRCGGCAWSISPDGALEVAPAGGASGAIAEPERSAGAVAFPWLARKDEVRSATLAPGVSLPADSAGMFQGCANLASVDASMADATPARDMSRMFYGCASLSSAALSGWDVSGATSLSMMFCGCSSLDGLDVSGWGVSSAKSLSHMFEGCSSLASLDLSGWDVSSASFLYEMFDDCSSLTSLDLSGWDVSGAKDVSFMFSGCSSLSELTVGDRFDASRAFPKATSDARGWWSVADGKWYTVEEIALDRAHVADTYLSYEPSA